TDVRNALQRLEAAARLSVTAVRRLPRRSHASPSPGSLAPWLLPVPHPLDYDWCFSPRAAETLPAAAERLSHGETVVLLGAPTVLCAVQERGRVPALSITTGSAFVSGGPFSLSGCSTPASDAGGAGAAGKGGGRGQHCAAGRGPCHRGLERRRDVE